MTLGRRADYTQFKHLPEKIPVLERGPGRPRKTLGSIPADKPYGNGPCHEYLRRRGIRHTIPEKADRPPTCPNATGYDECRHVHLGTAAPATLTTWLRTRSTGRAPEPTPRFEARYPAALVRRDRPGVGVHGRRKAAVAIRSAGRAVGGGVPKGGVLMGWDAHPGVW